MWFEGVGYERTGDDESDILWAIKLVEKPLEMTSREVRLEVRQLIAMEESGI